MNKQNLNIVEQNKTETGKIIFEDVKDGRARLFINIGKNQNISTGDLIREVGRRSGIDGKSIGKIDIHATYAFFEVPEQYAELVLHSFDNARIKGVPVVVEPAKSLSIAPAPVAPITIRSISLSLAYWTISRLGEPDKICVLNLNSAGIIEPTLSKISLANLSNPGVSTIP